MASAKDALERLRSSDGRIKVATLSGVSVLATVIALLVGVLPAIADHETSAVEPVVVEYGGGSGACFAEIEGRLPSAASNELHINNPASGTFTGPDGTEIAITVTGNLFQFDVVTPGMAVYDVVVNGGAHNNHYDYDDDVEVDAPVRSDLDLHAPDKSNGQPHNLSHINICYDVPLILFECGAEPEAAFRFGDGIFAGAFGSIFANSEVPCTDKLGLFFIDNEAEETTLDFGDETGVVAGRADFTKAFVDQSGDPDPGSFEPLEYDPDGEAFQVVEWCETRSFMEGDGEQFGDWLPTGTDDGLYPSLPDGETACKVAEDEDLSGTQFTVTYFEFVDPQFR